MKINRKYCAALALAGTIGCFSGISINSYFYKTSREISKTSLIQEIDKNNRMYVPLRDIPSVREALELREEYKERADNWLKFSIGSALCGLIGVIGFATNKAK